MSNPDETTTDNIIPMAGAPENQPPDNGEFPVPDPIPAPVAPAEAFAKALNQAVSAAQAHGVDQATIYGIVHAVSIQVEAPFRLMAQRSAQAWFNATQSGKN